MELSMMRCYNDPTTLHSARTAYSAWLRPGSWNLQRGDRPMSVVASSLLQSSLYSGLVKLQMTVHSLCSLTLFFALFGTDSL